MNYVQVYSNGLWHSMVEARVGHSSIPLTDSELYFRHGEDLLSTKMRFGDDNFLTFTARADGSHVRMEIHEDEYIFDPAPEVSGLQYRRHVSEPWQPYKIGSYINLQADEYAQFRNTARELNTNDDTYVHFAMQGEIAASGDMQSMLNYRGEMPPWCFCHLFEGCRSLVEPPEFSLVPIREGCCFYTFADCISLVRAPKLPAPILARKCYEGMFSSCNIRQTPVLPALVLAPYCYRRMFFGALFEQPPELPATTLSQGCYEGMFMACIFEQAPLLPATTLAPDCYNNMFSYCRDLSNVRVNFTEWTSGCTADWLMYANPTGTFIKPASLPVVNGDSNIPEGWTIENF